MPDTTNRNTSSSSSAQRPAARQGARPASANARPNSSGYRPQGKRPPVRRRKKKRATGRLYGLLAIIAILVIALIIILPRLGGEKPAVVTEGSTPEPNSIAQVSAAPAALPTVAPAGTIRPADPIDVNALNVNSALNDEWRSILLLGTDGRYWDDLEHTDTIIIACYNTRSGAIRMASVMRDTFVTLDTGSVRINTLKADGGAQLLIKTLNEKLGLNITEYMKVDFSGFRNLIDTLGGIEVDITETEMNYINSSLEQQVNLLVDKRYRESTLLQNQISTFGPSTHLNGLQALAYARIRKSDNDYKRTERQRTVIVNAVQKAIDTVTLVQMTQMATTMMQYVETNLSLTSVCGLGLSIVQSGLDDMKETRLPINDSFVGETRGKTWGMYDVDWEANKREMQSLLNGY